MHVPSTIEAEEAEEIGVEHLLRDIKDLSTGTLSTRVADRLTSLRGLQARLLEIRDYLGQVVRGELPVNHQIVYQLQDIFNLLPNIDLAAGAGQAGREQGGKGDESRAFTVATNDQLLVVYLSSLIRAVIALHGLVNNKLENAGLDDEAVRDEKAGEKAAGKDSDAKEGEKEKAEGKKRKGAGVKDYERGT